MPRTYAATKLLSTPDTARADVAAKIEIELNEWIDQQVGTFDPSLVSLQLLQLDRNTLIAVAVLHANDTK